MREEIKNRLNSRDACNHCVQNRSATRLLVKNIKACINVILPAVLHGCETWPFAVREEQAGCVSEWGAEGDMWGWGEGRNRGLRNAH
jgi:hypothetical protein